jgi:HSP20 family molecular chaperone IbpA
VVKEEGVPVWDERTDELTISKDPNIFSSKPTSYDPGRPPVFGDADIQETERDMIVKVDVPGVDKSKLKVQLEDSKILRVSGERNSGREENGNQGYIRYHHVERQHGYFQRMIELPAPAKDNAVPDARYENGVLTIRVPKAENSRKEVSIPIR